MTSERMGVTIVFRNTATRLCSRNRIVSFSLWKRLASSDFVDGLFTAKQLYTVVQGCERQQATLGRRAKCHLYPNGVPQALALLVFNPFRVASIVGRVPGVGRQSDQPRAMVSNTFGVFLACY